MVDRKQHFRHILLFYYQKGKNAVQARRKICAVHGEDVLTERQCQNWFNSFRKRPRRTLETDVDKIKSFVDANRRITTRQIVERLNWPKATVKST